MASLVRHGKSGIHYARIPMRGKLIWKSLRTDRITVAKLRVGDFHKGERQLVAQRDEFVAKYNDRATALLRLGWARHQNIKLRLTLKSTEAAS